MTTASRENAEAFVRRLYTDHGRALLGWAVGRFQDRRDAEEVVVETLVRAWRNHHQFDSERGSERAWMFGIARNAAVDHHRRSRRYLAVVPDAEAVVDAAVDEGIERLAERSLVQDALDDISDAHREVLVLAHFQGLTVDEMAESLGIPPGTVKSRLYYGMRSLRAALEERGVLQ